MSYVMRYVYMQIQSFVPTSPTNNDHSGGQCGD